MTSNTIRLVGVLNVTPDSFSDGGAFLDPAAAIRRAEELVRDGAAVIEIGGDSTRPGSTCVGAAEEWRRIAPVVRALAHQIPLAIDTHHAEVAVRALDLGAVLINDVTAGSDPAMFTTIAAHRKPIVLMFSRCSTPHLFSAPPEGDIVDAINRFLDDRTSQAIAAGVPANLIIRDTGLGAFVSPEAEVSWTILRRYDEVIAGGGGLMLGSSRKGFLKGPNESAPTDRDHASAMTGVQAAIRRVGLPGPLFIRTHNVALQRDLLALLTPTTQP